MGQLGIGRNNQLAENGLLYDSDGNVFDLTAWYKTNSSLSRGNAKSDANSTAVLLTSGATFTGAWEDPWANGARRSGPHNNNPNSQSSAYSY